MSRILANIVDSIMVIFASLVFFIATSTIFIFFDSTVLDIIRYIIFIMICSCGYLVYRAANEKNGNTIGRRATKTLVLDEKNNSITISTSILRTLVGYIISTTGIGNIINLILLCTDKERRSIEDRIFKTKVIDNSI